MELLYNQLLNLKLSSSTPNVLTPIPSPDFKSYTSLWFENPLRIDPNLTVTTSASSDSFVNRKFLSAISSPSSKGSMILVHPRNCVEVLDVYDTMPVVAVSPVG